MEGDSANNNKYRTDRGRVVEMNGIDKKCSLCGAGEDEEAPEEFLGIPVCGKCFTDLELGSVEPVDGDPVLTTILDEKGTLLLGEITALMRRTRRELGWKLLSVAPYISDQVEDPVHRSMMESGLIITGSSIIRMGTEEGDGSDEDERFITLFLILGQYLDISILGRITRDEGLDAENMLDGIVLSRLHDHILFGLLRSIEVEASSEEETVIINSMNLLGS